MIKSLRINTKAGKSSSDDSGNKEDPIIPEPSDGKQIDPNDGKTIDLPSNDDQKTDNTSQTDSQSTDSADTETKLKDEFSWGDSCFNLNDQLCQ